MALNAKTMTNKELFYGHKACPGCGAALAIRLALKVLGERTIAVIPPNCMSTVAFIYPHMPLYVNGMIPPFAGTAAAMSGILAGAKAQGLEDYHVVGFAGDGGTADIGLQALSGMIDRNDKAIFICYDNEAYMNTGGQRSSATTLGATTKTTPTGKKEVSKNIDFMLLHTPLVYQATASVGDIKDFKRKVAKAATKDGPCFIHVMSPCPSGWKFPTDQTIQIAKKAIKSGMWLLWEREGGKITINRKPTDFDAIPEYLHSQHRFDRLTDELTERIISDAKARYDTLLKLSEIDIV